MFKSCCSYRNQGRSFYDHRSSASDWHKKSNPSFRIAQTVGYQIPCFLVVLHIFRQSHGTVLRYVEIIADNKKLVNYKIIIINHLRPYAFFPATRTAISSPLMASIDRYHPIFV